MVLGKKDEDFFEDGLWFLAIWRLNEKVKSHQPKSHPSTFM